MQQRGDAVDSRLLGHRGWQRCQCVVLKDGTSFLLDKEQTSVQGWLRTLGTSSDEAIDRALSDFIGVPFVSNGITHTPITASPAALGSEQAWGQALASPSPSVPSAAPPAPAAAPAAAPVTAAPPLAPPAPPLTGPGSSPYWDSTPPPWARSK